MVWTNYLVFSWPVNGAITEGNNEETATDAEILDKAEWVWKRQLPVHSPGLEACDVLVEIRQVVVKLMKSMWTFCKNIQTFCFSDLCLSRSFAWASQLFLPTQVVVVLISVVDSMCCDKEWQ